MGKRAKNIILKCQRYKDNDTIKTMSIFTTIQKRTRLRNKVYKALNLVPDQSKITFNSAQIDTILFRKVRVDLSPFQIT